MRPEHHPSERLFGSVNVLAEAELKKIVDGAILILETVGIRFDDPEAVEVLGNAGARVVGGVVRFPQSLIETCLQSLPDEVVLGARNPHASLRMGGRRFITTNGFGTMKVLDLGENKPRPSTVRDLVQLTRLADRLDEVGYCQHQTTPQDVPPEQLDVIQALAVIANTSKHTHLSTYSAQHLDAVMELGRIASDGLDASSISLGCCSISPLRYPQEATQTLKRAAEDEIPFLVVCGAVAGVMSPITLAGTLVTQTAEHLAAVVLSQTIRAGTPLLLGSFSSPMDPRNGMQRLAAAELSLLNGATAQICRYFGISLGYGTGGISDSSTPNVQAGIEKAFTTLSCALSGVEVIHDAVSGILDSGTLTSYEQMVIDAELCRCVRRFVRGIDINDEALALDQIAEIGPGGNYLATMHTARNFRTEILFSDLWESGVDPGEASIFERAHERVQGLLAQPVEGPRLSSHQIEAMIAVCKQKSINEDVLRSIATEEGSPLDDDPQSA